MTGIVIVGRYAVAYFKTLEILGKPTKLPTQDSRFLGQASKLRLSKRETGEVTVQYGWNVALMLLFVRDLLIGSNVFVV
jgi:hypothetical protein